MSSSRALSPAKPIIVSYPKQLVIGRHPTGARIAVLSADRSNERDREVAHCDGRKSVEPANWTCEFGGRERCTRASHLGADSGAARASARGARVSDPDRRCSHSTPRTHGLNALPEITERLWPTKLWDVPTMSGFRIADNERPSLGERQSLPICRRESDHVFDVAEYAGLVPPQMAERARRARIGGMSPRFR